MHSSYSGKSFLLVFIAIFFIEVRPGHSQTGYFKTAKDFEQDNLIEADEVSGTSSALGSTVKVKHGKETERFNHTEIFAYVQDGTYYRFYKYATANVLIRGNLSFYGLIPTTIEFDKKKKIVTFTRESYIGGIKIFMSMGQSGEIEPVNKKRLKEYFANDPEMLAEVDKKGMDFLDIILLYNLKHPLENGFVMDGEKHMTFDELREFLTKD